MPELESKAEKATFFLMAAELIANDIDLDDSQAVATHLMEKFSFRRSIGGLVGQHFDAIVEEARQLRVSHGDSIKELLR